MDLNVHIAFGFHVNLYHSYRGDSHDQAGFGSDIRVIRSILNVLDDYNKLGVPVCGTWDFDNLFSLEQLLPEFAPDIIDRVRQRVQSDSDEIILMSYNNGLTSCMTPNEFEQAISWSISNPFQSGVRDIFGRYAPVVRPQEMMFSPSNIGLYRKAGIEALCLYYSGAPVDGFRTLIPLLPEGQSFNPLTFAYKGEKMTIIPAISFADLIDYGGLGALARHLHQKQERGSIDSDVLVLINTDADSFAWEGFKLPFPLNQIPMSRGLAGLIQEVAGLPYVVFDKPYHYLQSHPALAEITFDQDIADGSFDGYSSWAEKPINHLLWSRIERIRIHEKMVCSLLPQIKDQDLAIESNRVIEQIRRDKLQLMSTTNYGMASPHLNLSREKAAFNLSDRALSQLSELLSQIESAWLSNRQTTLPPTLVEDYKQRIAQLVLPNGSTGQPFCHFRMSFSPDVLTDSQTLTIQDDQKTLISCSFLDTDHHPDGSVAELEIFLFFENEACCQYDLVISRHSADRQDLTDRPASNRLVVSDEQLVGEGMIVICDGLNIAGIWMNGHKIGGQDMFRSFVRYRQGAFGRDHDFQFISKTNIRGAGSNSLAGYRFEGVINIPSQLIPGQFRFDIYLVERIQALFVRLDINYPLTAELDGGSDEISNLGRPYDSRWLEVAPIQISMDLLASAAVIKLNEQGDLGQYALSSFALADPANKNLDSFNHQVTAGLVGIGDGIRGVLLATDRTQLSSLAFCPMRLKTSRNSLSLSLNPFGTYTGRQRHHRSYAGMLSQILLPLAAPHLRSLAPAYNGVHAHGTLALIPFDGKEPDWDKLALAKAFSDGSDVFVQPGDIIQLKYEDTVTFPNRQADFSASNQPFKSLSRRIPLSMVYQIVKRIFKAKLSRNGESNDRK